MNERIKEIRRIVGLTQQEFASRIGVKRNTVATYEMGRSAPSDSAVALICREFNVNEHWLRTGEGEKFIQPDTFSLDEFARERGMTELELGIIKVYFNLPPPVRGEMLADLKKLLNSVEQTDGQEAAEASPPASAPRIAAVPARPVTDADVEAQVERYRQRLILEKNLETSSALIPDKIG